MTALQDSPDDGALQVVEGSEEDDKRRCQGKENGDKDKNLPISFTCFLISNLENNKVSVLHTAVS